MTPVQAMLWQIWRGWRWGLILGWAYLLVAAVVAHLPHVLLPYTSFGEGALPKLGQVLAMPCVFVLIHLLAVFTLPGAHDLKTKGYSPQMFVLPVRTGTLVTWPMIWGSVYLGCVWLFTAGLILRPTENAAPLVWPVAALAVALTLVQALQWMPLVQSWLGIFVAVPLILVVALVALLIAIFKVPELIATSIFLGMLPLTYIAGLAGVAASRRGDAFDWGLWNRLVDRLNDWRKPAEHPFRSAAGAQLWFECRSFAWTLPLFIALLVPFTTLLLLVEQGSDVGMTWRLLAGMLLTPASLAILLGGPLGNASFPFLATRPVSSAALVRSKLQMALVSAVAAYVPVLLVVPLFLIWPSFVDSALQGARTVGTPKAATMLFLAALLPVALTWKGLVENFWLGLSGRPWLTNALAFTVAALFGCGVLAGLWVFLHPEVLPFLWSLSPWLVGFLLTLKLAAAVWIVSALLRRQIATLKSVALMVGIWSVVVTAISFVALWLIPAQAASPGSILAALVLGIPFSRLVGAPLALDWNRHR